jgi:integrase
MSSWFNSQVRDHVTKEKTKVLYSLRHNFATGLKNKQILESVVAELMGHEQSTLSYKRYASDYDISILKEAVDKLDFDLL